MRLWVRSLISLSGLRIQRCCELWCRAKMWLGSGIAVNVVWADPTPSLGTSICRGCGPNKREKNKTKQKLFPNIFIPQRFIPTGFNYLNF